MVPADGGRNDGEIGCRRIGPRGEIEACDDRGARRRRKERRVAGADAAAVLALGLLAMVAAMMGRVPALGCDRRAKLRPAGVDRLQRHATEAGRPGHEEQSEQRELPEARHHP